jgi:hypothetical protein
MARLPTSTIVLAVLTCIPFGLAIRDTVAGTYDRSELGMFGDRDYDADEELDSRVAMAEYESRQRLRQLQREALVQSLYGADLASMGSSFENVVLGARVGHSSVTSTDELELSLLDDGVATQTLHIKPLGDMEICDLVERALVDAWGGGVRIDQARIWVNDVAEQRAIFDGGQCVLRFEKITQVGAWLTSGPESLVPMWAVGKPTKQLVEVLGARAAVDEEKIWWFVRGLGVGRGPSQLIADVRDGRVVRIRASAHADQATFEELIERVSKLVGKRPDSELIWHTTPKIMLDQTTYGLVLTIGSRPE